MSDPSPSDSSKTCPKCGAELSASDTNGLCPACLMAEVMQPTQSDAKPKRSAVLTPEELAPLFPQYEILRILGRGGMGAVYLARQISLNRLVAIKILPADLDDGSGLNFTERFKNEAQAMAQLSHPGIVAVYDFGQTTSGLLFIVMEYIEGTDVQQMVAEQGRLHSAHAMAVTAHVCDALAYAHSRGIIHRDIKPSNIMVSSEGVVKVADFGLAKMSHSSQTTGITQSGVAMGTLHFMAPEALTLGVAVDQRADIYAVGVMLYQMLTGKLPQGLFEMPSLQVPGLDPRYDGIVAKALREDRALRYQKASDLRHDLDAILTQPVVKVEPPEEKKTPAAVPPPASKPLFRPPPPKVIVRTEKKGSPLLWTALIAMSAFAGWIFFKDSRNGELASPEPLTAAPTTTTRSAVEDFPLLNGDFAGVSQNTPFANSLGMKFVPLPGTKVLMCIHETRNGDYREYAEANLGVDTSWNPVKTPEGVLVGGADDHPVVNVSWDDSTAFCAWLSKKEDRAYRLPSDREWSFAIGIASEEAADATPETLSALGSGSFAWGSQWPPPSKVGNFCDTSTAAVLPAMRWTLSSSYSDGFNTTAPVMSFPSNGIGIYDLAGNVSEWCQDWYNTRQSERVRRGSSWVSAELNEMKSSWRFHNQPGFRRWGSGFRCVIELASVQGTESAESVVAPSTEVSSTTIQRVTDLMPLADVRRDALAGSWTRDSDGALRIEPRGDLTAARFQFPHPTESAEFDYEIEFSVLADAAQDQDGVCMRFPCKGSSITWAMQLFPAGSTQWYGFLALDGKEAIPSPPEVRIQRGKLARGARHQAVVKVREGTLTGVLNGEELVHWKGDLGRFKTALLDSVAPLRDPRFLGITAGNRGGIIVHKATITEFLPESAASNLPTGPTTWKDTKGRSITAKFKAIASGNVLLDIAGKVTPVPLNTLSAESQKLARDLAKNTASGSPIIAAPQAMNQNSVPPQVPPISKRGWRSLLTEHPEVFSKTPIQDLGDGWRTIQLGSKALPLLEASNAAIRLRAKDALNLIVRWSATAPRGSHGFKACVLPSAEEARLSGGIIMDVTGEKIWGFKAIRPTTLGFTKDVEYELELRA